MSFTGLEVDECRAPSSSAAPQAEDTFLPFAALPSRFQIGERKRVLEANERALYVNLHIAMQRFLDELERGHSPAHACNALATTVDDRVTQDSFGRARDYMSGSAPSSFYSAIDRAWPAKADYGSHPEWWGEYLPKGGDYPLPERLMQVIKGAGSNTAALTSALQDYYVAAAPGATAEQLQRLATAKNSLKLTAEMVRLKDPAIRDRVASICTRTEQLLNQTATSAYSDEFDVAVRIAVDYLPHTVRSYMAIPSDQEPLQIGGGKSARELTAEQLDMISTALGEASENQADVVAGELLKNRHFLESRFGRSSLDIPPSTS